MKTKTRVFSVFPTCGKTWLYEHQKQYGLRILDSDSSNFSWKIEKVPLPDMGDGCEYQDQRVRDPEFPKNYIAYIKKQLEKDEYDFIFVSSHEEVRKALYEAGIYYDIVLPDKKCLCEYIGRCYIREMNGINGFPINVLVNNWNKWIDSCLKDIDNGVTKLIVLGSNEYLVDVLDLLSLGGSQE